MIIYDKTTLAFIAKAENMLKEILTECGFEVRKTRFLRDGILFPIHIVVFEGKLLGYYDPHYYQIGLNKKLIYLAKDSVLRDVLRHELAHYLTTIDFGTNIWPHGPEFKTTCESYGFPEEVSFATMNLEESNLSKEGDLESERIIEKVKKLLKLAESSNAHEAELATLKANELLLRHNLQHVKSDDEPLYVERVLIQKRQDSKMSAISSILKHFVVRPVISIGKDRCCLEVTGTLTNVKLAIYIAEFLDRELDRLWNQTKDEHQLRGLRAKNSFFRGVAKGFDEKMKASKENFTLQDQRALVVVERKLDQDIKLIYKRLRSNVSHSTTDKEAGLLGMAKGRSLTIHKGVESHGKTLYLS